MGNVSQRTTKGPEGRSTGKPKANRIDSSTSNCGSYSDVSNQGKNSPKQQRECVPPSSSKTNSASTGSQSPVRNENSVPIANPTPEVTKQQQQQTSLTRVMSSGSTGTSGTNGASVSKYSQIEKFFMKYKDTEEDAILANGMEKFCVDLGVDPTEFIVLVLAWKFGASQMCRFTREEFINGCQKMRAHDVRSLKERFPELLSEAKTDKNFKDLYNYTFTFGLDCGTGQRTLPIDLAIPLWDLVFTQNRPPILDQWFAFLKASDVKGVSRDTWSMFLPFINTVAPDLHNYDESEAWPSLFDDFVEFKHSSR